jgi:hypothetical protein
MATPRSAFWLSPNGDIIPVEVTHISVLIRSPELFGLTLNEVKDAYRRHGEPVGFEGRARGELMRRVLSKGWIRIRFRPRTGWTVELENLTPAAREQLAKWARLVIDSERYADEVRIIELGEGDRRTRLAMEDVALFDSLGPAGLSSAGAKDDGIVA